MNVKVDTVDAQRRTELGVEEVGEQVDGSGRRVFDDAVQERHQRVDVDEGPGHALEADGRRVDAQNDGNGEEQSRDGRR